MRRRFFVGAVDLLGRRRIQGVVHQGGFARTRHAGHAGEQAHRKLGGDVLQVVATRTLNGDGLLGAAVHGCHRHGPKHVFHRRGLGDAGLLIKPRAALGRHLDAQLARHVAACERGRVGLDFRRGALRHHTPTMHTRTRPHVDAMVGRANHVLIVFHHQHAVANVTQVFQGVDEPVVVALVQTNAGLVQHIHHAREPRANLRGQADALRLAA